MASVFGPGEVPPALVDDPLVVDDVLSFRRSIKSAEIELVDRQGRAVEGCRGFIGEDEKGPCFVYRVADKFNTSRTEPDGRLAVWVVSRDGELRVVEFIYKVDPHGWPAG